MSAVAVLDKPPIERLPEHARSGDSADILGAVLLPHITVAIWDREIPISLGSIISQLDLDSIDDVLVVAVCSALPESLGNALREARYPTEAIKPLASDIARLASIVADIVDKDRLSVRLEIVETDACRKFHSDYVSVRLITTYAGPGTQWLDDPDAARFRQGAAPAGLTIRALSKGQVALLKGREWAPETAIVHRSPPIAGSGVRRLVLAIDPARDELAIKI